MIMTRHIKCTSHIKCISPARQEPFRYPTGPGLWVIFSWHNDPIAIDAEAVCSFTRNKFLSASLDPKTWNKVHADVRSRMQTKQYAYLLLMVVAHGSTDTIISQKHKVPVPLADLLGGYNSTRTPELLECPIIIVYQACTEQSKYTQLPLQIPATIHINNVDQAYYFATTEMCRMCNASVKVTRSRYQANCMIEHFLHVVRKYPTISLQQATLAINYALSNTRQQPSLFRTTLRAPLYPTNHEQTPCASAPCISS